MTPGTERRIPASPHYPGLFAICIAPNREIVAVGHGAEEAVRERVKDMEGRDGPTA
jgi:hypothetical protein